MSRVDVLLDQLDGVRGESPQWEARCPAHDDRTASLSVGAGNGGKVVVRCHAGCKSEDVIGKVGLTWADLGNGAGKRKNRREIVATYDYRDELGHTLYQVVRFAPKDFRQRKPDGRGGWDWSTKGVRRVLYKLPAVLKAAEAGKRVYVVEGEKDADRLAERGLVATTNAGGADKWKDAYADSLVGAEVVAIPDRDKVGGEHAEKVIASCQKRGITAALLELPDPPRGELPPKGDVSDWFDRGGTVEELEGLADGLLLLAQGKGKPRPVLTCMADVEPEDVEYLWHPYLPRSKLTILEGDPGCGKTWISLAITAAITTGRGLPGREPTDPANVVFMTCEDGVADTIRPRLDFLGADVKRVFALEGKGDKDEPVPITLADVDVIDEAVAKTKAALVIVDPIQGFLGSNVDMHRANEVRPLLTGLFRIAERHGCAVLVIRHLSKSTTSKAAYRGLGSIDFTAAVRSVLMAGAVGDDGDRALVHNKSTCEREGDSQGYRLDPGKGLVWTGPVETTAADLVAPESSGEDKDALGDALDFLEHVLSDGQRRAKEVQSEAKEAGISERTLRRARRKLGVVSRRVTVPGAARGKGAWWWSLPDTPLREHAGPLGHLEPESTEGHQSPNVQEVQGGQAVSLEDGWEVW